MGGGKTKNVTKCILKLCEEVNFVSDMQSLRRGAP